MLGKSIMFPKSLMVISSISKMTKTSESNMVDEVSNALTSSRLVYELVRCRIIAIHGYRVFRKIQQKSFYRMFGSHSNFKRT